MFTFQQFQDTRHLKYLSHDPVKTIFYYLDDPDIQIEIINSNDPIWVQLKGKYYAIVGNQEYISFNLEEIEKEVYEAVK